MQTPSKTPRRWMSTLVAEADACKTRMPWERGLRRQALIARRATAALLQPRATEPAPAPRPRVVAHA